VASSIPVTAASKRATTGAVVGAAVTVGTGEGADVGAVVSAAVGGRVSGRAAREVSSDEHETTTPQDTSATASAARDVRIDLATTTGDIEARERT
jgi:hypothetical protein